MPRLRWDERTLGWFSDFSRYTGFHEKLAGLLRPALQGCESICDAGCGMGLVDLFLAPDVGHITCIDQSVQAIAFLRRECAARGISNLTALVADCNVWEGKWDAVLFSFFGTHLLERFLPRCKRLIYVVGADSGHDLLPGNETRRHCAAQVETLLREKNIPYSAQTCELEAGQPFATRQEALLFLQSYTSCTAREADDFLLSRLISARTDNFTYYLPRAKPIAIFTITGGLA